jgi:hypothetical protein
MEDGAELELMQDQAAPEDREVTAAMALHVHVRIDLGMAAGAGLVAQEAPGISAARAAPAIMVDQEALSILRSGATFMEAIQFM